MKKSLRLLLAVLFLSVVVVPMTGCQEKEGKAEKIGEEIDEAVEEVKDEVDDHTDGTS